MPDTQPTKNQLRTELRRRRKALGHAQQHAAALALTRSVSELPHWANAQRIALYLAADGEIDTQPLATLARDLGKQLYLPVIDSDDRLSFARWDAHDSLSNNRYDIPEPPANAARCPASNLDIIFLPLVGWDKRGGRLGMGGGFYDRSLSDVAGPLLVGLAHELQQVDDIPRENWDVLLDYVATEAALYRRQGK
jgi:5-formyltetrahydrofolate cyclo-ligase